MTAMVQKLLFEINPGLGSPHGVAPVMLALAGSRAEADVFKPQLPFGTGPVRQCNYAPIVPHRVPFSIDPLVGGQPSLQEHREGRALPEHPVPSAHKRHRRRD